MRTFRAIGIFAALVVVSGSPALAGLEATNAPPLSLAEAEAEALHHHPRTSGAELRALAAGETVTEGRSAYFPSLAAQITAASPAADNARLAAGGLNNPVIYQRAAAGITASQLITDFGRTINLVAAAKAKAKAESENAEATKAQIRLLTDTAYFSALRAQSVLRVASNTVAARQFFLDQVSVLATNQLRSELDVNFARIAYEEGRLLLLRAENESLSSQTRLSTLLGYRDDRHYILADVAGPAPNGSDATALAMESLGRRPDLRRLRDEKEAALKFARAEQALFYPTISAFGSVGEIPLHDQHLPDNYAAAGVNLSFPLFNGFNNTARRREAALRAKAAEETLREAENDVIRDVRIACLNVNNAIERFGINERLQATARQAYELADARYRAGSSSIVELSQAQLNLTSAEMALATARYDLLIEQAVLDFQAGKK